MSVVTRLPIDPSSVTIAAKPSASFVETEVVRSLKQRALDYLSVGLPVHLRGPAGSGKTTLALHIAAQVGRPVMFLTGDEELTTSHLIGAQNGYQYRKVVDRYIHSVVKYQEDATRSWTDHRLTTACREGHTLVYDEFTRSRAEANNILLGVLEERMLVLPMPNQSESYIRVHPEFRAIFTSNPQEYAGVHDAQDALSDRMVIIDVDYFDDPSEFAIAMARSSLSEADVARIVKLVREYRASGEYDQAPTLRASIMLCRIVAGQGLSTSSRDPRFAQACLDILGARKAFSSRSAEERQRHHEMLLRLIEHHCPPEPAGRRPAATVAATEAAAKVETAAALPQGA